MKLFYSVFRKGTLGERWGYAVRDIGFWIAIAFLVFLVFLCFS